MFKTLRELDNVDEAEIINSFMETKMTQRLFTSKSILKFNCQKMVNGAKRKKMSSAAQYADRDKNLFTGGKCGKFFYTTENGRFIVQTISDEEKACLTKNIGQIYDHLKYNQSVFIKYYGLYEISGKHINKINVVLMKNNN